MGSLITFGRRAWRAARSLPRFHCHLSNGATVWLNQIFKRPLPPLEFRNGFTWHHGPRDQPILLFLEIFVDRFHEQPRQSPDDLIIRLGNQELPKWQYGDGEYGAYLMRRRRLS